MAATTPRVTAFLGAFLNVLIKCIAALGFAAPARLKAALSGPAAGSVTVPAQATAAPAIRAAAPPVPAGRAAAERVAAGRAAAGRAAAGHVAAGRVALPAPRSSERGRSLPPTMKQRIRAEAHGTSPSARSVAVPVDGLGDAVAAAAASTAAADQAEAEAADRAGRRGDRALCG